MTRIGAGATADATGAAVRAKLIYAILELTRHDNATKRTLRNGHRARARLQARAAFRSG
jgi:hypothetical protein